MDDKLLFYVIPLAILSASALLGHWLGRTGRWRRALALGLAAGAALVAVLLYAEAMDDARAAIGVAVLTVLGLGPVVAGLLSGAALGWLLRRRG